MAKGKAGYLLTETVEEDFFDAKTWSLERWGEDLTKKYFEDLHTAAEFVADNHKNLETKDYLTGNTGLGVYSVREHYIVYVPLSDAPISDVTIAIVALIRHGRDIPTILRNNSFAIRREIEKLKRA